MLVGMQRLGLAAILFPALLSALQVASLSGTWQLNVEKSRWGKKPKPYSVVVTVEHNEPALKYTGTVTDAMGEPKRHFEYSGSIDGKEYAHGEGMSMLTRVDPRTVSSIYRSADGYTTIRATTTVSEDGKTLTRRMTSEGPEGTVRWTEVFEKQP